MAPTKRTAFAFAIALLAVGLVSVASPSARAASVPLTLYGSATTGWGTTNGAESNPGPPLTVNQGDSVTITLHSADGIQHEFLIDYNGNGLADPGEPVSSVFSSTTTVTFVASQAGSFAYLCLFHSSAMKGTFVVHGTSAAPSGDNTLVIVGIVLVAAVAIGVGVLLMRRRSK